jgi:hypothetical protein
MAWIQASIIACGLIALFLVLAHRIRGRFQSCSADSGSLSYGTADYRAFLLNIHRLYLRLLPVCTCWWRGISLARSRLYFDDIYHSFLIQLVSLVFLIIMWNFTFKNGPFKNITSNIGVYIVGFFFFGLLALALSNLRVIQEKFRKKGDLSKNFGRRWLTTIVIVICSVVLLGIGFASIFSTQFISLLGKSMNSISGAYSNVVYFLLLVYRIFWWNGYTDHRRVFYQFDYAKRKDPRTAYAE